MSIDQRENTGEITKALKSSRGAILSIVVFSFFVNVLMLTGPLFMLQIYDRVLTSGSIPTIVALASLVVILYGLYGFLEHVRGRVLMRVARILEETLRRRVFNATTWNALRNSPGGHKQSSQDLAAIRQFLSSPAPFSFLDLPWAPVYLFVIYLLHWWLGVAATFAVAILGTLALINNILTARHTRDSQQALQQAVTFNEETRRNVEMATVLGMLDQLHLRWKDALAKGLDSLTIASDRGGLITSISKTMRLMSQSAILGLGA